MKDLWENINEAVPNYMRAVCKKYDLKCEKISNYYTVLYNTKCCWIIQIGKLYTNILYIRNENGEIYAYDCGDYLAARFDEVDRQDLITVNKAGDNIRNELSVVASGFVTKCEDIFTGDKMWFEKYLKSSRCAKVSLMMDVIDELKKKCFEFNYHTT